MGTKSNHGAEKRSDLFHFAPERVRVIDDPDHPLHDPYRVAQGPEAPFIANVAAKGVVKAVIVRKNGKGNDGETILEIVDGRQRVLGARAANKIRKKRGEPALLIPVVFFQGTDEEALELMIELNEFRREDSMLAKAKKARRLINLGQTPELCAKHFGVTPTAIENWLKLLDCGDDVQKAIHEGTISPSIAMQLADMPRADQSKALADMVATGATKGASAEAAIRRGRLEPTGPAIEPGKLSPGKRAVKDGDAAELVPSKPTLKKIHQTIEEKLQKDSWSSDNAKTAKIVLATLAFVLDGGKLPGVLSGISKQVAEMMREKRQKAAERAFQKAAEAAKVVKGVKGSDASEAAEEAEDEEEEESEEEDDEPLFSGKKSIFCSVCGGQGLLGDEQTPCAACDGDGGSAAEEAKAIREAASVSEVS